MYPCVRVQSDVMVTADIYTHKIYEINVNKRSVKVISRMPSTIDEISEEDVNDGIQEDEFNSDFEGADSYLYD